MPENAAKRATKGRRNVALNGLGTRTGLKTTVSVINHYDSLKP
ncbi:hypothetical protein [Desulfonatronum sp. SC1]|nr:hypothetical protein [Desulfonatronum sp. SC1]